MKLFSRFLLALGFVLVQVPAANATQYLTLGAGDFAFNDGKNDSTNFNAEWRGSPFASAFVPVIGATANTDSGVFGYAGINYDWQFAPSWYLTPGIDVGGWHEGDSKDLGYWIEFRETLELDYRFNGDYRAGVQASYLSNLGLNDRDPGATTLMATFSIPLGN